MEEKVQNSPEQQHESSTQEGGLTSTSVSGKSYQAPPFQLKASPVMQRYSDDELMGRFDPGSHADFEQADGYQLRGEVAYAWERMQRAAAEAGVTLRIVSATRNFDGQAGIWNAKFRGTRNSDNPDGTTRVHNEEDPTERAEGILDYSSMPGTSRHHWGTDIDINSTDPAAWEGDGPQVAAYTWLESNAESYGFCQTYDAIAGRPDSPEGATRTSGYEMEKWHWSYIPLASEMQAAYVDQIDYTDLTGFEGSEQAQELDVINTYVNSISPACGDMTSFDRPELYRITASSLTVRSEPSTDGSRIRSVRQNEEIFGNETRTMENGDIWLRILDGWIAIRYEGESMATQIPRRTDAPPTTE